uniref:SRCR domain-containing protein n=1 Tax=Callorhinchus milii TaxID=7868 RepID=A0A4W3IQW5_CALMI
CKCKLVLLVESVRLVNSGSPCAGRVEVYHRGQWGTVDGFGGWDMKAAAVVCKELGCGIALSARRGAHFGKGSRFIVAYNVQCRGSEAALSDCPSGKWNHYSWPHSYDVGVICSGSTRRRNIGDVSIGWISPGGSERWLTTGVCKPTSLAGERLRPLALVITGG